MIGDGTSLRVYASPPWVQSANGIRLSCQPPPSASPPCPVRGDSGHLLRPAKDVRAERVRNGIRTPQSVPFCNGNPSAQADLARFREGHLKHIHFDHGGRERGWRANRPEREGNFRWRTS